MRDRKRHREGKEAKNGVSSSQLGHTAGNELSPQGNVWETVEHTPGFPTKGSGGWGRHP